MTGEAPAPQFRDSHADHRASRKSGESARRNGAAPARMLRRLLREVQLVRGTDDRFYGCVTVAGHREVHELGSEGFAYWLIKKHREHRMAIPTRDRINALVRNLEADAAGLETTENVWIRVADGSGLARGGALGKSNGQPTRDSAPAADPPAVYYLDLGDSSGQCVEITAKGCRLIAQAPVLFRRPRGFGALPTPQWDGSIELLKKYLNVAPEDFPLVLAFMTAALRPVGPYPILVLAGEQGSAKTTMGRFIRRLIDPSSTPLKAPPSSHEDFMIQAHNNWLMAYDNFSSISAKLSDSFCRLATGGGYSTRLLYSTDSETLIQVERPALITSIADLLHRSDLVDRCIIPRLPVILDRARRRRRDLETEFDADYSRLVGALHMAVAAGLKMLSGVDLAASPRMADFAQWGEAVIRGLGGAPGSFLDRYDENRRAACDLALDDNEVAQALRGLMDSTSGESWCGTASDLLAALAAHARPGATKTGRWPRTPTVLSHALRLISPQLRTTGISVVFDRVNNVRTITIMLTGRRQCE
jgi:hypothetical protein